MKFIPNDDPKEKGKMPKSLKMCKHHTRRSQPQIRFLKFNLKVLRPTSHAQRGTPAIAQKEHFTERYFRQSPERTHVQRGISGIKISGTQRGTLSIIHKEFPCTERHSRWK